MHGTTPSVELVLVGAGHAHVQVLRRLAMAPFAGVRTTLIVDRPLALYSGMVPGLVAGQYGLDDLAIDAHALARRAGVRVILAAATRVDPAARVVHVAGRPPIYYDVASLNVGSTVAGEQVEGVREHALATRPLADFIGAVERLDVDASPAPRASVVGAGAAGIELACALRARGCTVTLLDGADTLLPDASRRWRARVAAALSARAITVKLGAQVAAVTEGALHLENGQEIPHDFVVWAAGAAPPAFCAASDLPKDPRGYLRVRRDLRVVGHDDLFAVGDCAVLDAAPWVPRAGVYAVRGGAVLVDNLEALLRGWPLRAFRPQRDFLTLLNLADGTALGRRGPLIIEGAWVFRLKDRIDRRFVERFRALEPDGAPSRALPAMAGADEMVCGGCAAKVGQTALEQALSALEPTVDPSVLLGVAAHDDVSVTATPSGERVVSNIDAFRAFCDDAFIVGKVAAMNAMSDLWAKGIAPRHALALVALPPSPDDDATARLLADVLAGARSAFDPASASLIGGHTVVGTELSVGFAVLGYADKDTPIVARKGLRPGDLLVLTKALGTGILLRADALGCLAGSDAVSLRESLCRPNDAAMAVMLANQPSAATDVTGFGLLGHLAALCRAGEVTAELWLDALPRLPGAAAALARGVRSTFHEENARAFRGAVVTAEAAAHPLLELTVDPQTSGGLLFGVPADRAAGAVEALAASGHSAAVVGRVVASVAGAAGQSAGVSIQASPRSAAHP
ncbi:MAG: selenide, water dikinase SelD [Myxococcota bacterium]